MKIAFSGTANTGKTTLVSAFLKRWPMYITPLKSYRDVITENNLEHSSKTSGETQLLILDYMMREQDKYTKDAKVVYDRCPWDNIAYTLQGNQDDLINDEITAASISLVREALKQIDIIFWFKYDPSIRVVKDGLRDTNVDFIKATDKIFEDLYYQYCENLESDIFYPKDDCPAIIQLDGKTVDDRIQFIGEFLDYKGDLIETQNSILDPSNTELLEQLIGDQQKEMANDLQVKKLMKQIRKS